MKITLCLALLVFLPAIAISATIHVPDDYPTIQGAIIASTNGDTIIVRPGTYFENIDFIGKEVTLKSEKGPRDTIIDGMQAGSVVTYQTQEGEYSVLDGFTVTNGFATEFGGGIHCYWSSPTIINNRIIGNSAFYEGGGIACIDFCYALIADNVIYGNSADYFKRAPGSPRQNANGGGIACRGIASPTIIGNTIARNVAIHFGGGIYCDEGPAAILSNHIILNEATERYGGVGAGIFCGSDTPPIIIGNTIVKNISNDEGGGIAIGDCVMSLTNNTIAENSARNQGGGIYCSRDVSLTIDNSILWDNAAPEGSEIWIGKSSDPSTVTVRYSTVKEGQSDVYVDSGCTLNVGPGLIHEDPLFAEPVIYDYHLTWNSPCRNTGDDSVVTVTEDFEGDPRIAGGAVDMGADEYYYHLYLTGDVEPEGSITLKAIGDPGTIPVKIYRGSLRTTPLSTQYGLLFIKKPFPHIWNIGPVPSNGIATTTKTIPSGVSPGAEFYFQALHGPAGDPTTKLTNLLTVKVK